MKVTAPGRLGPYELVSLLGAGGMGVVYRAHDPRLKRDVALKVLADGAAIDPSRQRRFLQESQAAGALNHPNIVAVYDVGAENGVHYFVSELVEGSTLRQELERGPLPLRRLIEYAAQIGDGLAAAHDAGLVHRDLKPENVMVAAAGRVKILDFGLAKTSSVDFGDVTTTQSAVGLIVGTAPYMSPEQARGAAVDWRSDQFSFGTMLYEMATGRQAFRRETAAQTLSAVLEVDPPPIGEVNPAVPVPLRWVIERCLRKNVEERYASTADLSRDLHTIRDRLSELGLPPVATPLPATAVVRWRPRLAWLLPLGAAVLLGGGWAITNLFTTPPLNLANYRFTSLATDPGYQGTPAWSPDGKTLAYVAEVNGVLQVFTRTVGSPLRTQITRALHDCSDPFWSPDGSRVYFHSLAGARTGLFSVGTAGGEPELVLEDAASAALSPDGRSLVFLRRFGGDSSAADFWQFWTSAKDGTSPRRYAKGLFGKALLTGALFRFSPDGKRLLVWAWSTYVSEHSEKSFWVIPWPDGDPQAVLPSAWGRVVSALGFSWMPDGRHIMMTLGGGSTPGRHLWMADVDSDATQQITTSTGNESAPAVAPNGRSIAFTQEDTDFDVFLIPMDGSPPRPLLVTSRNEFDPAWSPRDRQYAYVSDRTGNQQIWLRSRDGQWERPLVTDADFGDSSLSFGALAFSPDGQRLAYQRQDADGHYHVYISQIGGGRPARASGGVEYQNAPTWSPDGNWIAFFGTGGLRKVRVGSTAEPVLLNTDQLGVSRPAWSPDGKWIAYDIDGLVLVSPDRAQPLRPPETSEWLVYGWGADATTLFGLKRLEADQNQYVFATLNISSGRTLEIGGPIGTIPVAGESIRGFTFIPGEGFLTSIARVHSDLWMLEGFQPPGHPWPSWWPWRRP